MKKIIRLIFLIAAILLSIDKDVSAQTTTGDSLSGKHAFANAVGRYYAALGQQSLLYNGPEYYFYDPLIKGSAYFLDVKAFTAGTILYDGARFEGVPMLYDLYSDNVVCLLYNHYSSFSLLKERVKSFDFLEHHFVNISADTLGENKAGLKSGFYDEIYHGRNQVLVKRVKTIQTTSGGAGPESYFDATTSFYLCKSGAYYSFSGQGALLDLLRNRKKELQQFIRNSEIKFKADPEGAMVKIVAYYDHLAN